MSAEMRREISTLRDNAWDEFTRQHGNVGQHVNREYVNQQGAYHSGQVDALDRVLRMLSYMELTRG